MTDVSVREQVPPVPASSRSARSDLLTKATLKSQGWTEALIKQFLGEPDETPPNPKYANASPMCLYRLNRVQDVEKTGAFQEARRKAESRRANGRNAAEKKRQALLDQVQNLEIDVPIYPMDELLIQARQHYDERQCAMEFRNGIERTRAYADSDPEFLYRIAVNFLRHECTHYERWLVDVTSQVGADAARLEIKLRVLEEIARHYPELAAECDSQASTAKSNFSDRMLSRGI